MSSIDYTEKMKKLGPLPEDMRVFWVGADVARIEAKLPYTQQCIREGREILVALDDVAQIIGSKVRIVPDDDLEIAKALTHSAAVLVDAEKLLDENGALPVSGSSMDGKLRREQDYVVTTGRDPYEAFVALTVVEKAAEIQILSDALGGVKPIPDRQVRKLRQNYLSKYSKPGRKRRAEETGIEDEYISDEAPKEITSDLQGDIAFGASEEGSESFDERVPETLIEEFKGRKELVEYGKKLIEKKLVQGTWGNLSFRVSDDIMVVTPTGLDYDSLAPEDMVTVNIESKKYDRSGNKPTTELGLHADIYKLRPDVGAIIHTHSKYCSVFAACNMPLEVMDTYLAEEVAAEIIHIADYAPTGSDELNANVVKALGGYVKEDDMEDVSDLHKVFSGMYYGRKGCLIANHGMVAVAADLDSALEVAEAMEEAARKLINKRLTKLVDKKEGRP